MCELSTTNYSRTSTTGKLQRFGDISFTQEPEFPEVLNYLVTDKEKSQKMKKLIESGMSFQDRDPLEENAGLESAA